jgi:streptogramin lyase
MITPDAHARRQLVREHQARLGQQSRPKTARPRLRVVVPMLIVLAVAVDTRSAAGAPREGTAVPASLVASHAAATVQIDVGGVPTDVEATPDATWVSTSLGSIVRVDPRTNERVARIEAGGSIVALKPGLGALWAIDVFGDRLLRIDPTTNRVERELPVDSLPSGLAIGHGLVWVASQLESTVAGIDPATGHVVKLARFHRGELWPGGLAVGPEGVWVITGAGNQVSLFDPATMRFRFRLRINGARTLVAAGRSAWVGLAARRSLARVRNGRLSYAPTGIRTSGYGPTLRSAQRLWLAEGSTIAALDPTTGAVEGRLRLRRVRVSGLSVAGDLWIVDAKRSALLRVDVSGTSAWGAR